MAPHSSVLAWRIPGTGEPGGLPDVSGVAQSRTRLKRLSSSSSSTTIYKTDTQGLAVPHRELYSRSRACVLSCSVVLDSFVTHWSVTHQAPLSLGSPGKNLGAGRHSLLQGIFLTQGPNPRLRLDRRILYH